MVAIDSIEYYSKVDDSSNRFGFISFVELQTMVVEPTMHKNVLSENTYILKLLNVASYQISIGDADDQGSGSKVVD